ncbi:hypothetical protein FACS189487_07010 [Campylobacterota bacterium]|nr:hypothetical protein FACS189487_07010 [Campylobacterota bacterium]
MSVELRNATGKEFYFSTIGWAFYLNLATIYYGWEKSGTQPPKEWRDSECKWSGDYDWNAGQIVTAQDAKAYAVTLTKYLADPNRKSNAKALAQELGKVIETDVSVDENDDAYINSFIEYANSGGFEIW